MAVGAATNIIHLDGRLCSGPTDLTAAFPHGGTNLGEIRNGVFAWNKEYASVEAEEFGGQRVDYVSRGDAAALTAVLREFDAAALSVIFPNVSTSSKTGKPIVKGRSFATTASGDSIIRSGDLLSDQAVVLLFSANSPEQVPSVLVYSAMPLIDAGSDLVLSTTGEAGFPVAFQATHNATGHLYEVALLTDMTLSPT